MDVLSTEGFSGRRQTRNPLVSIGMALRAGFTMHGQRFFPTFAELRTQFWKMTQKKGTSKTRANVLKAIQSNRSCGCYDICRSCARIVEDVLSAKS